jgi:hypothetical protein
MIQILEVRDLTSIPGNAAYELAQVQSTGAFNDLPHEQYRSTILDIAKKYVGKTMKPDKLRLLDQILTGPQDVYPEQAYERARQGFLNWLLAAAGLKVIRGRGAQAYWYESVNTIANVITEDGVVYRLTKNQRILKEGLERLGYVVGFITEPE